MLKKALDARLLIELININEIRSFP